MKKRILIIFLCAFCFSAKAEDCAAGKGTLYQGNDKKTYYCESKITMNWWSAFAWCDSIGGQLFDINTECKKVVGGSRCPQFSGYTNASRWTVNTVDNNSAFYYGGWDSIGSREKKNTANNKAFCTMPDDYVPEN